MSDNEEFLARWSRRKLEAKQGGQAEPEPAEPVEAKSGEPADGPAADPADPDVDLSNLPPIDSIDAATDITAFLRKGIPSELSRAALRRAWITDPAIRDFVGLAENAWDFDDPNAMPGFGPLDFSQAELSEIAERIVGGVQQVAADLPDTLAAAEDVAQFAGRESSLQQPSSATQTMANSCAPEESPTDLRAALAASQPTAIENDEREETLIRRRTHGGALPR